MTANTGGSSTITDNAFSIQLQGKKWYELFSPYRALTYGANFDLSVQVSNEGLEIRNMDPAHIAMVQTCIRRAECLHFFCDKKSAFSIELWYILRLISNLSTSELGALARDSTGEMKLSTILQLDDTRIMRKLMQVRNREIDSLTPLPAMKFDCKFEIHRKTLLNILTTIRSNGGVYVRITTQEKDLIFSDPDTEITLPNWKLEVKERTDSQYSVEYLLNICRYLNTDIYTVQFATAKPLMLSTHNVNYYIAPAFEKKPEVK